MKIYVKTNPKDDSLPSQIFLLEVLDTSNYKPVAEAQLKSIGLLEPVIKARFCSVNGLDISKNVEPTAQKDLIDGYCYVFLA